MTAPTADQPTLFDTIRATPAANRSPIPDWLVKQLERQGTLTPDGITRRVQARTCKDCRAPVLVGLDHPVGALAVHADPWPLTALGEALALIDGRRTVTLNREGGRWVLNERYDLQITDWPAGTKRGEDVLRQHRCHTPPPDGPLLAESTHHQAHVHHLPPGSPPPF